ncbi:MAG: thioredoxin domain-containing protein [bacterium]|nr:thioredoxin domain-containing protein [bacterium]MDA1024692.1 thioredoxin domain-containing protein [bacterium]
MKRSLLILALSALTLLTVIWLLAGGKQQVEDPFLRSTDAVLGAENPNVTILVFGNPVCESCVRAFRAADTFTQLHAREVQFVAKDFRSTSLHDDSLPALYAAECARQQGAYFSYINELLTRPAPYSSEVLLGIANDLELNTGRLERCMKAESTVKEIEADQELAESLSLTAAPAVLIGDDRYIGTKTESEWLTIFESYLP